MLGSKDDRRQKFGTNSSKLNDCRMLPAIPTLKKETIEATYEHVNRLVKVESGENFDNVKEFIEYDEKLNVFEKKVQAIIVDSLRIKEGVINGLLSDDVHLISRVLKCDWFFKDAVSPEFYETTIFPNVSFSTRCKIINRLSKNIEQEEHAERLFQFTRHNYGSKYAEVFLPRCSSQFITAYIAECKPLFHNNNSVKILMNIFKRFPDIPISFLETVFQKDYPHKNVRRKYTKLLRFIAKNNPVAFISFFEKYYSELMFIRFGKKLTKSFATELRTLVKNSSGQLLRGTIDHSVFFSCLNFEDQVDFLDGLVRARREQLTTLNWCLALPNITSLMKVIPPNERVRLLETAFYKIFNHKFEDHPEIWSIRFLEMLPLEYRVHFLDKIGKMKESEIMNLQLHVDCEDSDRDIHDIFIYLLDCKNAVPKLSALMPKMVTSVRREILLKEMIRNCTLNLDSQALESVLNFILKRHKNDDPHILLRLLQHLKSVTPKIMNLNIWGLIEQIATLVLLNVKEYQLYHYFIENYIRFRLKNKLDVQPQVKNMVKLNFIPSPYVSCLLNNLWKPFCKDMVMLYYDEIFHLCDNGAIQEDVKQKLLLTLLRTINFYNSKMRRHRINTKNLSRLVDEVDKLMKDPKYNAEGSNLLSELIEDPYLREKYATNLLQVSLLPKTLEHLLKLNPEYIVNSLDNILNDLFSIYGQYMFKKFITSRTRLDFLNITSKIRKLTSEKFKTSVSCTRKVNALKMYSYFATIEEFSDLISEYVPEKERMHLDKDNGEYLEIQTTVPRVLKNVKPDSKNWPLISKYLNKDFLRWVLSSFNSACYNSPSSMILPILKEYFPSKSISVKKVILYRVTDISVNDEKLKYFWELWNIEKHSSVRSVIFQTILKCFYENPSREIFEIVKKCISEADEVIIKDRPALSKIPAQYLNEYTICLWNFTEKYENSRFTTNFRNDIISQFAPMNIWTLSEEFCDMVIKRYLFDCKSGIMVNNFCCYYLISNPYSMNQKLLVVLKLMQERRNDYNSVKNFLGLLWNLALQDPKRFVGVFDGILEEWPKIYGKVEMFNEYLCLRYSKGYNAIAKRLNFQLDDPIVAAEFGKEFRVIFNEVPDHNYFIDIFQATVEGFIRLLKDFDVTIMINNFLGQAFGRNEALIAVKLLPQTMIDSYMAQWSGEYSPKREITEHFHSVFKKLKDMNDDVVKIYMNLRHNPSPMPA